MEELIGYPFSVTPLWVIFLGTVALCAASVEVGFRVSRSVHSRLPGKSDSTLRTLVSAELVLLAFVLSFTFQLAMTQFTARRQSALSDAIAIKAAWLRTTLLPTPSQAEFRDQLRQYAEVRLEANLTGRYHEAIARSEVLQREMWMRASELEQANPKAPGIAWFLAALNNLVEVHSKRLDLLIQDALPRGLWVCLYLLVTFSMLTVGYHLGLAGTRQVVTVLSVILSVSAVLVLIGDLDHPRRGGLRVSQIELQRVLKEMR